MKATKILKVFSFFLLGAGVISFFIVLALGIKNEDVEICIILSGVGALIIGVLSFAFVNVFAQMADNIEKIQIDVEKIANRTEEEKE